MVFSHGTLYAVGSGTTLNFPDQFFQWTGGTLNGESAGGDWTNTGVITLSGIGAKLLQGVLHNQNRINQTTDVTDSLVLSSSSHGGILDNQAGATFDLQSNGGITNQDGNFPGNFLNNGLLLKSVNASHSSSLINVRFTAIAGDNGQGEIHVQHDESLVIAPAGTAQDANGNRQPVNYVGNTAGHNNPTFLVDARAVLDPTGGAV